ncbi:hypothetical protein LY78DRAFT_330261 [Colletotrichum sublineola]|nr:hypothetical protein LY78DRAFT_330261 [Colletotrichum sublineola]
MQWPPPCSSQLRHPTAQPRVSSKSFLMMPDMSGGQLRLVRSALSLHSTDWYSRWAAGREQTGAGGALHGNSIQRRYTGIEGASVSWSKSYLPTILSLKGPEFLLSLGCVTYPDRRPPARRPRPACSHEKCFTFHEEASCDRERSRAYACEGVAAIFVGKTAWESSYWTQSGHRSHH